MLKIPKLTIFGIAVAIAIVAQTATTVLVQQQSAFAHSSDSLNNPPFQAHFSGHMQILQDLNPTDGIRR
jgi:hypothetical protein